MSIYRNPSAACHGRLLLSMSHVKFKKCSCHRSLSHTFSPVACRIIAMWHIVIFFFCMPHVHYPDIFAVDFKGNLAHNFMDLYFLCLSFHLDISNMLKTKYIGNTGLPASHRGEKIQFGNPFKFGFPNHSPCVMSLL